MTSTGPGKTLLATVKSETPPKQGWKDCFLEEYHFQPLKVNFC